MNASVIHAYGGPDRKVPLSEAAAAMTADAGGGLGKVILIA